MNVEFSKTLQEFKMLDPIVGLQSKLKRIGDDGCYLMAFLSLAGVNSLDDLIKNYDILVSKGLITRNCFIKDNAALAKFYGLHYKLSTTKPENEDAYIIEYHNSRTGYSHFVLCVNGTTYDTLENSITVKEGTIVSYRIFK